MPRGHAAWFASILASMLGAAGCGAPQREPAAPEGPAMEIVAPIARDAAGEPVSKLLRAYSQEELEALDELGLVRFESKRRYLGQPVFAISLTEEGKALGLEVDWPSPDWPWGPSGVRTKEGSAPLCRLEFAEVTAVEAKSAGPPPTAEVTYVRRHTAHSPLYARLGTATPLGRFCDTTAVETGRFLLVQRPQGWRRNRPPAWEGDWKAETSYEYDKEGRVIGAVTKFVLNGRMVDPDGDAVALGTWSARRPAERERTGDGVRTVELVEAPVVVEGSTVTFRPEIWDGRPAGGSLRLEASDPWEAGGLTICLEGSAMGC